MKCGCYLLAHSSLEKKLFASLEHPWLQDHAKNPEVHQTESRTMWITQPYVPWFTKVNCLFTREFLSSYTMINICVPTWAEEKRSSQLKGCVPHFSFRLAAPSAPHCLKRERWAGGPGALSWLSGKKQQGSDAALQSGKSRHIWTHLVTRKVSTAMGPHGTVAQGVRWTLWESLLLEVSSLWLLWLALTVPGVLFSSLQDASEPKPGCWAPISPWLCAGSAHRLLVVLLWQGLVCPSSSQKTPCIPVEYKEGCLQAASLHSMPPFAAGRSCARRIHLPASWPLAACREMWKPQQSTKRKSWNSPLSLTLTVFLP